MNKQEVEKLRLRLIARREELQRDVLRLDRGIVELAEDQDMEGGSTGNHMSDDSSSLGEQEVMSTLEGDLQRLIGEIDNALRRIEAGTYGVCQRCGIAIDPERLQALPHVAFCITCQELLERQAELYGTPVAI